MLISRWDAKTRALTGEEGGGGGRPARRRGRQKRTVNPVPTTRRLFNYCQKRDSILPCVAATAASLAEINPAQLAEIHLPARSLQTPDEDIQVLIIGKKSWLIRRRIHRSWKKIRDVASRNNVVSFFLTPLEEK